MVTDYFDVKLETKDLILKKAEFEDWKTIYYNLWRHKESAKYMLWQPTETDEADEFEDDDDDYDDDDDDMYEAVCPNCQNTIVLSDSVLDEGTMHCPCCNELLEFDYSDLTMDDLEHKEEDAEDAESETEPEA